MTWNLLHLARMLKDAGGIPAHGNQRSGCEKYLGERHDERGFVTRLAECPGCERYLDQFRATIAELGEIKHPYRGDVVVDLVAPDGTSFRLKGSSNDSGDNVITTYEVDASAEDAAGTWQLKVQDVAKADSGYVDAWSLQF